MKQFIWLSVVIATAHCGALPSFQVITPNTVVASQRIGGNFAYSTIEGRATPHIIHSPAISYTVPNIYTTASLAAAQPFYKQSSFGSPFFNPIFSGPFYPGFGGQAPVIGQAPIFGQYPIIGQVPGQIQGPIQGPVAPVAPAPPQGVPQGPAPPPPGAVVDDDTVSVESA